MQIDVPEGSNFTLPEIEVPQLTTGGGIGGGGGGGGGGANRAAAEAARLTEQQSKAYDDIREKLERTYALNDAATEAERDRLENLYKYEDTVARIRDTVNAANQQELIDMAEKNRLQADFIDLQDRSKTAIAAGISAGEQADQALNEGLSETQSLLEGSFDIVANGLSDGIKGLIDGTKEWNDVLGDVLASLGDMLLQFGLSSLKGALFPGVPGFAEGGVLPANGPAIVGENGPELVINRGGQSRVFSNRDSQAALQRYSPANARSIEELAMGGMYNQGSKSGFLGPVAAPETTFKLETVVINGVE